MASRSVRRDEKAEGAEMSKAITFIAYKATCWENGKAYIGITCYTMAMRRRDHLSHAISGRGDAVFQRALKAHAGLNGPTFDWEVLETIGTAETKDERIALAEKAGLRERELIALH
jgi:hypothetical protein